MSVFEQQQARKAAERDPVDWDKMRAALIESGMVAEAWQRRHREGFGFECQTPDDCEHYKMAAGQANSGPPGPLPLGPAPFWWVEFFGGKYGAPKTDEPTVFDELWREQHGGDE